MSTVNTVLAFSSHRTGRSSCHAGGDPAETFQGPGCERCHNVGEWYYPSKPCHCINC